MTTIITMEGSNASYPPLKVVSTNTGVTIPLSPRAKGRSTWLSKALREDGSKPSRGSRETARKLAGLIPEGILDWVFSSAGVPAPLVYVSYASTVYFLWEVQRDNLEIVCLERRKISYTGNCGSSHVEGTEKLRDTLPEVIGLWLRRLYG